LIESSEYYGRGSKARKLVNYKLFNGIIDREDFEYVTNPYGFKEDELPADFQHYDFISPKISLLLGEEINRPFNFRVMTTNPDATSQLEFQKTDALRQAVRDFVLGYENEEYVKEIEKYVRYNFQDAKERNGQQLMNYMMKEQRLAEKFNEGFKHALISGEEFYWTGVVEGQPICRVVNPLNLTVILDPDEDTIDEAAAIIEERWLTLPTIINDYHSELSDTQIKTLENLFTHTNGFGNDGPSLFDGTGLIIRSAEEYSRQSRWSKPENRGQLIRVVNFEWASFRKLYFLEFEDPQTGRNTVELMDETFEIPEYAMKKENEWHFDGIVATIHWIKEYWAATKIHEDYYVAIGPKENQRRSMDNPSKCKSSYVGKIYNALNAESVSIVERMKTYQYLIDIAYFRIEMLMAKDKGRPMVVDLAQIPLSKGWDLDKWMYYLDALGIAFINSMEEGPSGQRSQFNQFQSIDMTTGGQINYYIELIANLEDSLGRLVGVSRQREGQQTSSELVGSVERSIQQSAHITEYWFYKHSECKRQVLEALVDVARLAYKDGKKINYISDDMGRVLLDLNAEDFALCEYAVFVSNTTKDTRAVETMRSLAQAMLQNDKISAAELATIMVTDDMASLKRTLETAEENRKAFEQQMAQEQTKQVEMQIQAQAQETQAGRDHESMENELDRINKLEVEALKIEGQLAQASMATPEQGDDGNLEERKLSLQEQKQREELKLKKEALELQRKKLLQDLKLSKEELAIKRKQANKPTTSSK
jgi:hypothetical protein